MRLDGTVQYRGAANFKGSDNVRFADGAGVGMLVDNYTASKSEWLVMANAYLDLGTWNCFTPFVGFGGGFAINTINGFRDDGVGFFADGSPLLSVAFGPSATMWNLAYALHAGVSYQVSQNFFVEIAYSYISLGNALSGDLTAFDGTNTVNNPMNFNNITSNDVRIGVRWLFNSGPSFSLPLPTAQPMYQPQPIYQPQQVYQPQPVYQAPAGPLMRRS